MMNRVARTNIAVLLMFLLTFFACACNGEEKLGGKDYSFTAGGVTISIGDEATAVNSLGTPKNIQESASCGGIPGTDRNYLFSGFRVYTTPAEKGDVICKIELVDDSVKTPEGIAVGVDCSAVLEAMGDATSATDNSLIYEGKSMKLTFILRDGAVTNIQYATN